MRILYCLGLIFFLVISRGNEALASGATLAPIEQGYCKCFAQNPLDSGPLDIGIVISFPPLIRCTQKTLLAECAEACRTQSNWNISLLKQMPSEMISQIDRVYLERVEGFCLSKLERERNSRRVFERHILEVIPLGETPPNENRETIKSIFNQEICIDQDRLEEVLQNSGKMSVLTGFGALILKHLDKLGSRAFPIFLLPLPTLSPEELVPGMEIFEEFEPRAENSRAHDPRCLDSGNEVFCQSDNAEIEVWSEAGEICTRIYPRT